MKYFIITFKRDNNNNPAVDKTIDYYDLRAVFQAMETLRGNEELFCVYEAECILDFS